MLGVRQNASQRKSTPGSSKIIKKKKASYCPEFILTLKCIMKCYPKFYKKIPVSSKCLMNSKKQVLTIWVDRRKWDS